MMGVLAVMREEIISCDDLISFGYFYCVWCVFANKSEFAKGNKSVVKKINLFTFITQVFIFKCDAI